MKFKRKIQIHSDTDDSGSDDLDTDGSDDDDDLQEDFASTSVNKVLTLFNVLKFKPILLIYTNQWI